MNSKDAKDTKAEQSGKQESRKPKHKWKAPPLMAVLRGFVSDNGEILNVWCPDCHRFHIHGWTPELPPGVIKQKTAHCDSRLRHKGGDYYVGEFSEKQLRSVGVRVPRGSSKAKKPVS